MIADVIHGLASPNAQSDLDLGQLCHVLWAEPGAAVLLEDQCHLGVLILRCVPTKVFWMDT